VWRTASALAGAALLISGCGSGGQSVKDDKLPYSFDFPSEFQRVSGDSVESTAGKAYENETVVAKGDGAELVSVQTQALRQSVTSKLLPRVEDELEASAREVGTIERQGSVKVDDLPGFEFRITYGGRGTKTEALWTYAPKGRTLYWVNCQWQNDRQAVLDACSEVLETLELK